MSYTNGLDNPELYFQTKLYTGNASTNAITLDGSEDMQPDWVWLKSRSFAQNHENYDSVRGATKRLYNNLSNAEDTNSTGLTAFNSDGFTLGSSNAINKSGDTFVSWNWKAGGSSSSNTNGSITSSVSASTTAGFSIVSYTGTGSNATVGHSLGTTPSMIIFKNRDSITDWRVYHKTLGATKGIRLSSNGTEQTSSTYFNNTEPTSSLFTVSTAVDTNENTSNFIAYCFAEKKGYSKFGSYTGNGNADGTFVYTGFKPAWVLVKRSDASESWFLYDNKRNAYTGNERYYVLRPNITSAENTTYSDNWQMDFLSNGFKLRTTAGHLNSGNLIYMAFAESPFTTSTGIPTTAM